MRVEKQKAWIEQNTINPFDDNMFGNKKCIDGVSSPVIEVNIEVSESEYGFDRQSTFSQFGKYIYYLAQSGNTITSRSGIVFFVKNFEYSENRKDKRLTLNIHLCSLNAIASTEAGKIEMLKTLIEGQ